MTPTCKILCIDDDPVVLAVLRARFERQEGYEVLTTSCGEEGIKLARKYKPAFILLDWMMPKMSGLAVLRKLKGNNRTTWIRIFMLTSRLKMTDVEKALSNGATGYFTKPLKLAEISMRLERLAEAA